MGKLRYGTSYVLEDEPCYWLGERFEQSPGSKGFHRYQTIRVLRGDNFADFRKDMGPIKQWKGVMPLVIFGFWEHTVGELRDMADDMRKNPSFSWSDVQEERKLHKIRLK